MATGKTFEWNWNEINEMIKERVEYLTTNDQMEIMNKMKLIREAVLLKAAPAKAIILG